MKKHSSFILSCIVNYILSVFSYFYLCISITSITGTVKGSSYEIQEPEKSAYVFIGVTMLIVYILVGLIIQCLLYKRSKQSKKKYIVFISIICVIGIITGYSLGLVI